MKKVTSTAVHAIERLPAQKLTIGLDLGDRASYYGVLDEAGRIVLEEKVATTPKALQAKLAAMLRCRMALEPGWMPRPWPGWQGSINAVRARTSPARARITVRSACACALR